MSNEFVSYLALPENLRGLQDKDLANITYTTQTDEILKLGDYEFQAFNGKDSQIKIKLSDITNALLLFYPGASYGAGLCKIEIKEADKEQPSAAFLSTNGAKGCTGQLQFMQKNWEDGNFGQADVIVFTTKNNVNNIAEQKGLTPKNERGRFLLVSVDDRFLEILKNALGLQTFQPDGETKVYLARTALVIQQGKIASVNVFPQVDANPPAESLNQALVAQFAQPKQEAAPGPDAKKIRLEPVS